VRLRRGKTRSDAIEHLEVVAQMFGRQRPNNRGHSGECLTFISEAIGDTSRLDADIEAQLASTA
jgi:hypothetical protein